MCGCGPVGPARIHVVGPTGWMRRRGSGLRGRAVSTARRHVGEAGQIAVRLSTIHSRSRCDFSQTKNLPPSPTVDAIGSTAADGRVPPVHATTVTNLDISALNTDPRMWALRVLRAPSELLRALRLCRSSRPRLERGGRRIPASHQSRCRKLLATSDGSNRKPQLAPAIRGLLSGPRRASP